MPYEKKNREWWINARITKKNDARYKITDEDLAEIKRLHRVGEPIREIARVFEGVCSRRTIQFILFPERRERVKARAKEVKRWEAYNTKEYHTPAQRKYRAKLKKLYPTAKSAKTNAPQSRTRPSKDKS